VLPDVFVTSINDRFTQNKSELGLIETLLISRVTRMAFNLENVAAKGTDHDT
jgi:hypothetical protein